MRGFEESELVENLKELIDYEWNLENKKEILASWPDFNLTDCFRLFDFSGTGLLSYADIQEAFNLYGVYPSWEESQLILNWFDVGKDGRLEYREFEEMFNPKDWYTSDMLILRGSRNLDVYYPWSDYFVGYTRDDFVSVLRAILSVEVAAERIWQRLNARPLFNRTEAFSAFDSLHKSYITHNDFADLLAWHWFFATEKELVTLVDRFDKKKTGIITYSDFIDEITPQSPSRF